MGDTLQMKTWEVPITLANGKEITLELESDIEPSQSDIFNYISNEYDSNPQSEIGQLYTQMYQQTDADRFKEDFAKRNVPYNQGSELIRNIANVPLFEFADEIEAFARSKFGGNYEDIRNQLRAQQTQYRLDHPAESILTSLGTGLFTGGTAVKMLQKSPTAYKWLMGSKDTPLGKRIMRLMTTGGAGGALAGTGAAEEVEDIPKYAGAYGAAGATFPTLLIGGGMGIKKGYEAGKNILTNLGIREGDPQREAFEYIASTLANSGKSPEFIESELTRLKGLGLTDVQLGELTSGFRQLSKRAFNVPSASDDAILDLLGTRKNEMTDFISENVSKRLNIKQQNMTPDYIDELAEAQAAKAREMYPEAEKIMLKKSAFDVTDADGNTVNLIDSPLGRQAYEKYRQQQANRLIPEKLPEWKDFIKQDEFPTSFVNKIKRGIKSLRDDEVAGGKFKSDYGIDLQKDMKSIDKIMRKENPAYAKANDEFADSAKLQEIYDQGLNYQKMSIDEFEKLTSNLKGEKLEAFKVGIHNKIREITENLPENQDLANKVFKNDRMKKAFENIFENKQSYDEFEDIIKFSKQRKATAQKLVGGSPTKPMMEEESVLDTLAKKPFSSSVFTELQKKTGMPPAVAENIKKQLINADPAQQQALIKMLKDTYSKYQRNQNISNLAKGGILGLSPTTPSIFTGMFADQPKNKWTGIL